MFKLAQFGAAPALEGRNTASKVQIGDPVSVTSLDILHTKYNVTEWALRNAQHGDDIDELHRQHVELGHRVDEGPYHDKRSGARFAFLKECALRQVPSEVAKGILLDNRFGISVDVLERADAPAYAEKEVRSAYAAAAIETAKSSPTVVETEPSAEAAPEFLELLDCNEANLPKRDWIVEDVLERGTLSILAGQGGSCKSTLGLYLGMSIAAGQTVGPFKPTGAYRVGCINVEDDVVEQRRRMFALLKTDDFKGISVRPDLFNGRLHTLNCSIATLVQKDDKGKIIVSQLYRWLVRQVQELGLDVLIIDPLVEISEGINENDNSEMHSVMKLLRMIARQLNVHVIVVHHFNKPGTAKDAGSVRGGSSIVNMARMAINVEKASDQDCKDLGIDDADRHNRIKLVIPKANNSATGRVHWFAIEPKRLLNGEDVAAVEHIQMRDEMVTVSTEAVSRFLDIIERGRVDLHDKPTGDRYNDKTMGPKDARAETVLVGLGVPLKQARNVIRDLVTQGNIGTKAYTNRHREETTGLFVLKRPANNDNIPF